MLNLMEYTWFLVLVLIPAYYIMQMLLEHIGEWLVKKIPKIWKDRDVERKRKIVQTLACITAIYLTCLIKVFISEPIIAKEYIQEANATEGIIEGYILDSQFRSFSYDEISKLSDDELFYIRNGIYARHGRIFTDEELKDYYYQFTWYVPQTFASEFDSNQILSKEWELINTIKQIEEERKKQN